MRIEPTKWQVRLPIRVEEISAASVREPGKLATHGLALTTCDDIARRRRESPAEGLPTHIALSGGGYWAFLYPTPTKAYDLTITEFATLLPPRRAGGC